MTRALTTEQLLRIQGHAIRTGNLELRRDAYAALGFDARYGFCAVTPPDREAAMQRCASVELSPCTITCDDRVTYPVLYWSGSDWTDEAHAHRYDTRDEADADLTGARRAIDDRRKPFVEVEQS